MALGKNNPLPMTYRSLNAIPATAQTALDNIRPRRQKQFFRRLIEEGDRVFRTAWTHSQQ
jgi:hypothetical protein